MLEIEQEELEETERKIRETEKKIKEKVKFLARYNHKTQQFLLKHLGFLKIN
ncbi:MULTISPECIES: hypothetical protein [Bacillales]|jgi:hypothetical protein|uniref:hypothetical protein n=1 Tax=Bacillales TaxID=1385 RepID=UPI00037DC958|nr:MULTISPECIES: hypothetical protein [Bacillaceae]